MPEEIKIKKQNIYLENKNYLKINGVNGIVNLTETDASILIGNEILNIKGENLKAENLNVDTGELILTGLINMLKYDTKKEKQGLLKRMFK